MKALSSETPDRTIQPGGRPPALVEQTLDAAASARDRPQAAQDSAPGVVPQDEDDRKQAALVNSLLLTIRHFFGGLSALFGGATDPRDPHRRRYPLEALLLAAVLMYLCRVGARRQVAIQFRNRRSLDKMNALFEIDGFPHGDTLNRTFSMLDPKEVQDTVTAMVTRLIRAKVLDGSRLFGRFVIAIDGTGVLTFKERHCPTCLTRTQKSVTTYYHSVLEAKLVTPAGFAFSLMTEFIENEEPNPSKQDCELRAFYRLAHRLHERCPRLPILLTLDGLFAGGPTLTLCERYGWKYFINLKDDSLKSVNEEFANLSPMQPENRLVWRTGTAAQVKQEYQWVTDVCHVDTEKHAHLVSVLQCLETAPDPESPTGEKTTKFKWITNMKITQDRVVELATNGGRIRWKIENEGFNVQKTGGYELEHAYSENPTAAKVFYFLLQVAHIIFQLLDKGSLLKKAFPKGFGSLRNLADRILEAWRNARHLTREALTQLFSQRIQIRFDTS